MMQKILIISNYYPPEKGAAANRIEQLALQLKKNNYNVSVVCPLPNYPQGKLFAAYKGTFSRSEICEGIHLKRLWIYPSVSKNIFVRLLSVLSFSLSLIFYLTFQKTPQKVVVQSPPLLLSFLAIFVLGFKNKKIILNVSDLWPLAAIELKALKKDSFSHKISKFMERFIYKKANLILAQSDEICTHVKTLFPDKRCYLYQNFPNHVTADFGLITEENQPVKIFYAGLLGIAQGVFELCKAIDLENKNLELHLFGEGNETEKIKQFVNQNPTKKIFFHGMKNRAALHQILITFDVALIPLTTRIYGSVPSKIFEYSSMGFPVLYFGGGEGETIVSSKKLGWIAQVGNFESLNIQIELLSKINKQDLGAMKKEVFKVAKTQFDLEYQMQKLLLQNVF